MDDTPQDGQAAQPLLRPYRDITRLRPEWIIPGLVPSGMLTLLAGMPGLGKSLLCCRWAGELAYQGKATLLITAEDSPEYTIRARLDAVEANVDHVYLPPAVPMFGNGENGDWIGQVEAWIREADASLVTFDPFTAMMDAHASSWNDQHVRLVLAPLADVAERTGCAIVFLLHLNKGGVNDPLLRIGGSIGFAAAARSVLLFAEDPEAPDTYSRVLAHAKCNVGPLHQSQRFEVAPILLTPDMIETARLEYLGPAEVFAHDLIQPRRASQPDDDSLGIEDAKQIILAMLSDPEEGCPSADLEHAVLDTGISRRTYDRARREIGVRAVKVGKTWVTRLA